MPTLELIRWHGAGSLPGCLGRYASVFGKVPLCNSKALSPKGQALWRMWIGTMNKQGTQYHNSTDDQCHLDNKIDLQITCD